MKKILLLLMVLTWLCLPSNAADPTAWQKSTFRNGYQWSGHPAKDNATKWAQSVESQAPRAGDVWYVDGNMENNNGDGKSWKTAFKLLSTAMAASHADIAVSADREWASRNTIWLRADEMVEDFTAMAQKTDIIGVGSNDGYAKAGITGTWIIPDTVSYLGCRFFNIMFTDDGATPIIDMDTQGGIVFTDCLFDASAATTIGMKAKDCSWLELIGCEFSAVSATPQFDTACVQINDGDNAIYGVRIQGTIMTGAAIGIDWDDTAAYNCFVTDNYIRAVGLTIDEEGDNIFVINNRLVTDVDTTTSTAGYDFNIQLSAGNIQMGVTGLGDTIPFAKVAE